MSNSAELIEELKGLQDERSAAMEDLNKAVGRYEQLQDNLREFGVKTVKGAKKKMLDMTTAIEIKEEELEALVSKLRQEYEER